MKTRLSLAFALVLTAGSSAVGEDGARMVWQPVLEFMTNKPSVHLGGQPEGMLHINPFVAYTNVGTDFGFHGPGERFIGWGDHDLRLDLESKDEWAGMWHSLVGLASASNEVMDFARLYPDMILPSAQPRVTSLQVSVAGKGRIKLEIKGADQGLLWDNRAEVNENDARPIEMAVSSAALKRAKFLNWTAEPGSKMQVSNLRMGVQVPAMDFDRHVLLASYAKMARCYEPGRGLTRDRAHVPAGAFDSVTASGVFALATAVVAQPEAGFVDTARARDILHEVEAAVAAIPKGMGLLPHFVVRGPDGRSHIHAGTEFSTVDTAICYHGLLLAAELLNDEGVKERVLAAIRAIDFTALTLPDGAISHGLRDDGRTVLPFSWKDWGGETALVMLLAKIAGTEPSTALMQRTGKPWQGTGFIAEVQSLFYPDFDTSTPDSVSKVNWREARRALLAAQKNYFPRTQPDSRATRVGIYGLSAGEGAFGTSYDVGGVDLTDQRLIHPHYILMSGVLEDDPQTVYHLLDRMEHAGWFTAWGLVENITFDGSRYLPMISSLNAGFETIGAYHLLAKARHIDNAIYQASRRNTEMRQAAQVFYPARGVTTAAGEASN